MVGGKGESRGDGDSGGGGSCKSVDGGGERGGGGGSGNGEWEGESKAGEEMKKEGSSMPLCGRLNACKCAHNFFRLFSSCVARNLLLVPGY